VLKFRSMRTNCDARIHEEYVNQFIAGQVDGTSQGGNKPVFKRVVPCLACNSVLSTLMTLSFVTSTSFPKEPACMTN